MKTRFLSSVVMLAVATVLFTSCSELVKKVAMKAMSETAKYELEDTVKWGSIVEQDIALSDFSAIDAKGRVRIVYTQDSVYSVRARANEKCLDKYVFTVRKDELKVEPKDFDGRVDKNTPSMTLYISAPDLTEVEISGSGKLDMPGKVVLPSSLDIEMEGAGDICIEDLTLEALKVKMSGAAKCALSKVTTTGDIEIEVNGAGDINANVFCQELNLELNGAGNAVLSGECKNFVCEENGASKVDFSNLKR